MTSPRRRLVVAILVALGASCGDSGQDGALDRTTNPPETTAPPTPEPYVIEQSDVRATLARYDQSGVDFPFEDGAVVAHWYTWRNDYVVVFAGWDASQGDPQCPGNSFAVDGDLLFASNSPTTPGSCDPEDMYRTVVPRDDRKGARLCGPLVIYNTLIPALGSHGEVLEGTLHGTIERVVDGQLVGATSMAEANLPVTNDLNPHAAAYEVPEGWLPNGATEVVC